jgi:hypothetical protein
MSFCRSNDNFKFKRNFENKKSDWDIYEQMLHNSKLVASKEGLKILHAEDCLQKNRFIVS